MSSRVAPVSDAPSETVRWWSSRGCTATMGAGGGAMTQVEARRATMSASALVALLLLAGAAVAVALGVYGHVHDPANRPVFTLGFSGMLQMKVWLTTAALALLGVQLVTALWMWERLPAVGPARSPVAWLHRWSGSVAFVLTLPVAFHCLWALGFVTGSARVVAHGLAGCAFYGAYA